MPTGDPKSGVRCDELDFTARIRFPEVIAGEYEEIDQRRRAAQGSTAARVNGRPPRMMGLAFSGGSVRSATFNLGLLQALAAAGKLKMFDYLSTVSGGGYVGGWWSAWLSRHEREEEPGALFPPPEDVESERDDRRAAIENAEGKSAVDRPQPKDSAINAGKDPIHHLRLFSSMMTPRQGLLSADTWGAVAVVTRSIVLTWLILRPVMLAAILLGQAWFTLAVEPQNFSDRFVYALVIPGLLLARSVVCVVFWLLFSRRWQTMADKFLAVLSVLAFLALTALFKIVLGYHIPLVAYAALVFWFIYVSARLIWWKVIGHVKWSDRDFWRNRIVLLQTKTLSYSVVALAVFLFAGFGYEILSLLLAEGTHTATNTAAKAGGWSMLALAAAGSIYKAITGNSDASTIGRRIVFASAPPLLLLVLGIVLSWIGRQLYLLVQADPFLVMFVTRGALVSGFLFLIFAMYELRQLLVIGAACAMVITAALKIDPFALRDYIVPTAALLLALIALALIVHGFVRRRMWIVWYALSLAIITIQLRLLDPARYAVSDRYLPQFVLAGLVMTLILLVFELVHGRGGNRRAVTLTVIGCTIVVVAGAAMVAGQKTADAHTLIGLIAMIAGWVLVLGWLTDPNLLTMHGFYKERLIRAYLGASNARRGKTLDAEITDAIPGDDLLLTQLKNTERGAPYHLINTMVNLAGSGEYSTRARSSDSFLMSKLFCGSMRTGFRPTREYACGSISLGTAVAVSGADAGSPAALSALMALFNVRLGYWTPTPSLSSWRSGSARFWPVFRLQEMVSQALNLLPYCYLTDGGHYENTGVYSLIQRGCNLIVAGECGTDPETILGDLGNMIRRVRIDFGTEIVIDVTPLRMRPPRTHVVVGEIRYGSHHAAMLGLPAEERTGTLIVVKPNLAGGEPFDVQQYGYLNPEFPHQQTLDLWYDEAQFESYRRLGEESGQLAIATGKF